MSDQDALASLRDFLTNHGVGLAGLTGWAVVVFRELVQWKRGRAEAELVHSSELEKRVVVTTSVIDVYKGLAEDTKHDAAERVRDLKRECGRLKKEGEHKDAQIRALEGQLGLGGKGNGRGV